MSTEQAEVVIVGAGLAGSIIAYQLGMAGIDVLVLESGPEIPVNRAQYLERFYTATLKTLSPLIPQARHWTHISRGRPN